MELGRRKVQFPHAFDVNLLRTVHHDFGDAVVLQEWFNRPVPQDFIADVGYQAGPFATGHHKGIPFQHPLHVAGNDIFDFLPAVVRTIENPLLLRRHFIHDLTVYRELQVLVFLFLRIHRPAGKYVFLFLDGLFFLYLPPQSFQQCHNLHPLLL